MPDDNIDDKIAEQNDDDTPPETPVDDALKSFLEDDPGDVIKPEDGEPPESDDKKPDEDDKKPDEKKKPDDKKKDDGPVYSDDLDKRIKDLDDKEPPPGDDKEPEKKPEPEKKKEPPPKAGDFEIELSDDDLSDDLKEYKTDYPDDYKAITTLATMIAKKMVEAQGGTFDESKFATREEMQQVGDQLSDTLFWNEIAEVHSDARKINKSKDFLDWLSKQDEPIQRVAGNMESPKDGIMILDYYKAANAKGKVKDVDKKAAEKKKQTDDLHKGSMRNRASMKRSPDEPDKNDAKAAFDEDD